MQAAWNTSSTVSLPMLVSWLRQHLSDSAHLVSDSRRVMVGDAFFALPGARHHGVSFIAQAIQRGAAAIVVVVPPGQEPASPTRSSEWFRVACAADIPICCVVCGSDSLGEIANDYYCNPSRALNVVAVTGTNGKTSTTYWIAQGMNDRLHGQADSKMGSLPGFGAALSGLTIALDGEGENPVPNEHGRAVVIGTSGAGNPEAPEYMGLTTPDALTLQTLFHQFHAQEPDAVSVVAMEASSIGLDQGRMTGTAVHTAVFTNLTRDHLDYHGSMDAYGAAKCTLFSWPSLRAAVVNLGDPLAVDILDTLHRHPASPKIIGYWVNSAHGVPEAGGAIDAFHSMDDDARDRLRVFYEQAMRCDEVLELVPEKGTDRQHMLMMFPGQLVSQLLEKPAEGDAASAGMHAAGDDPLMRQQHLQRMFRNVALLRLRVLGRFNKENVLAAAGAWRSLGWNFPAIVDGIQQLKPVPGRMEVVGVSGTSADGCTSEGEGFPTGSDIDLRQFPTVVVDYAHTPDALTNVLLALRELAQSRGSTLHCVFGAGGNRDRGKRPEMASAVQAVADRIIVTSDNPRNEAPEQIVEDICSGLSGEGWKVVLDRQVAIEETIASASPADVVLIAGKGRERTQEVNGVFHPFSDVDIARQALEGYRPQTARVGGVHV